MHVQDLSDEEFAQRGAGSEVTEYSLGCNAIFEEQVLPQINDPESKARHFVVTDIETGEYEVSEHPIRAADATERLLERCPEAKGRIWTRRVGSPWRTASGDAFYPKENIHHEDRHGRFER